MALYNWEVYSDTPAWHDILVNTIVFSGSASDLSTPIQVGEYNEGTHLGSNDPGTDQCGSTHCNNVKYISDTEFQTGTQAETINSTNFTNDESTLRIKFRNTSSVAITGARLFCFDGVTTSTPAIGVHVYAFESPVTATEWSNINDHSEGIGGDITGERLDLADHTDSSTTHYFYAAISVTPESMGVKTEFDFGIELTFS